MLIYTNLDFLLDEDDLTFKEDLVFEDGAVYNGQVKNDRIRHGYGV